MKIPYTKASVTQADIEAVTNAAAEGWGDKCYDKIIEFEKNFAHYSGCAHAVATSSATGALHLGLHALGLRPNDEVILADINWVATVAPVVHLGAKPIFVDIDRQTWCVDASAIEKNITRRTRVVIRNPSLWEIWLTSTQLKS